MFNDLKINETKGYVSTFTGNNSCGQADGNLGAALFSYIQGIYFDAINDQLLISDYDNNRVKVLDFSCMLFQKIIHKMLN